MKVLVTGKTGKLVTYFQEYVKINKPTWEFRFESVRGDAWKSLDLASYDAIIHCAGIVAAPNDDYEIFREVNVNKTEEIIREAVRQKVRQFIYLSSMSVYDGIMEDSEDGRKVTVNTVPRQKSNYGKSKYEAEEMIRKLSPETLKVALVRTSTIVGGGMSSNFKRYVQFSKIPVVPIPCFAAKRSFVYIDSLLDFFIDLVEKGMEGVYFPQSLPLLSVSEIMEEVCKARGIYKRKMGAPIFNHFLSRDFLSGVYYDESLNILKNKQTGNITSKEAIRRTIEYEMSGDREK